MKLQEKYSPKLLKNPDVAEKFNALKEAHKAYEQAETALPTAISNVQKNCNHEGHWHYVQKRDPDYDIMGLISKTCTECSFEEQRPEGSPYRVCYRCWSPMQDDGWSGGNPDVKVFHYKCTSCGWTSEHT